MMDDSQVPDAGSIQWFKELAASRETEVAELEDDVLRMQALGNERLAELQEQLDAANKEIKLFIQELHSQFVWWKEAEQQRDAARVHADEENKAYLEAVADLYRLRAEGQALADAAEQVVDADQSLEAEIPALQDALADWNELDNPGQDVVN